MTTPIGIQTYAAFWPYYLAEHKKPWTKRIHLVGLLVSFAIISYAVVTGQWTLLWLPLVTGYGFAWLSHLLIEKNIPATFKYPLWSFISDFRMAYWLLTGKLRL